MTDKELFDVKSALEMLEGMELKDDTREALKLVTEALGSGMSLTGVGLTFAAMFALQLIKTLQKGVKALEAIQLEVELEKMAIQGLMKAVIEYTVDMNHTTR